MENLYIIIPAYNEEANIAKVATEWHEIVKKLGNDSKLVIINDGSKDSTLPILENLQEQLTNLVVLNKANGGHGDTILYGYKYAIDHHADYVFQTDSDGQTLPKEFWGFWEERKNYNAIIGYRKNREDGISRVFVTKVLKLVIKVAFKESVVENVTGLMFKTENVKSLAMLMQNVIENHPKKYLQLKEMQKRYVDENLKVDVVVDKYIQMFNSIINNYEIER